MENYLDKDTYAKWCSLNDKQKADIVKSYLCPIVDLKPAVKGAIKENDVMSSIKYNVSKCSSKPNSTDLRVVNNYKVIYVEVKNYTLNVPVKEMSKFINDIESKSDIFGALFLGWNENKFYYHKGIPVLLMKSYDLVNEGLDLLFSLEPRKNIEKILDSVDEVVSMLNIIDNMTTNFMKNRDELRSRILIFKERCSKYSINSESSKLIDLIKPDMHSHNEVIYGFIRDVTSNGFTQNGKDIHFKYNDKDLSITLLKTKTKLTFPYKDLGQTISLDIELSNVPTLYGLLKN